MWHVDFPSAGEWRGARATVPGRSSPGRSTAALQHHRCCKCRSVRPAASPHTLQRWTLSFGLCAFIFQNSAGDVSFDRCSWKAQWILFLSWSFSAFFEYKEDGGRFPNPPSYNVATTLPTYDEAERSKEEAAVPLVAGRVMVELNFIHYELTAVFPRAFMKGNRNDWCCVCAIVLLLVQDDDFVARDDFEDADQLRIGNDGIFMLTFFSKISSVISTAFFFFIL